MAEAFIQLPSDGTGKKTRTKSKTVSSNVVHETYIVQGADPTYYIFVAAQALAANKYHLAFLNAAASGQIIRLRKLFFLNAQLAAVTGVGVQFDVRRISSISGGTTITPNPMDTADGALTNFTCVSAPTSVTEGVLLYSWFTNNDEIGLTNAFPTAMLQALGNAMPEGNELKELNCREGEGFTVKQITSTTIGSYAMLAVITKELLT